jgi:hypothetical protein
MMGPRGCAVLVAIAGCAGADAAYGGAGGARDPQPAAARRTSAPAPAPPINQIYKQGPSWESAFQGDFATGAALADLDHDGMPELVVANGNDMSPQQLIVYHNHCDAHQTACYNLYPEYYSGETDYHAGIAVGDIDHDGWLDVAIAVPFDKQRDPAGGGIKIYLNHHGHLELAQRLSSFGAFNCALADVNGDGQLDLVVPVFPLTTGGPGTWIPQPARIYLNAGGRFADAPSWTTQNSMLATGVTVADINQDGWMDVAFAGQQTFVYYGGPPTSPGSVPIAPAPAWSSTEDHYNAIFIDAGRIPAAGGRGQPGDGLTLAVSRGCYPGVPGCTSDFVLYRPEVSRDPVWRSAPASQSSSLLLADLNGDGLLELIGGQWGNELTGGPLWIFQGRPDGYRAQPDFVTAAPPIGPSGIAIAEGIAVGDTRDQATTARTLATTARAAGAVITLPDRQVAGVVSVEVAGRPVAPHDWAFAIAGNTVSLAHPYAAGDALRVRYTASPVQDIVEATWDPQRGNLIYNSFLPAGPQSAGRTRPHQETQR